MEVDEHDSDRAYLKYVFKERTATRPDVRVFSDHGIDFQCGGVQPLSPDIAVVVGDPIELPKRGGVFPVVDRKARILFIIELVSQGTRRIDLVCKPPLYYQGGVPLLILSDAPYSGIKKPHGLLAYRAGRTGYESVPLDSNGRIWLDVVNVWLGLENGRLACFDADGKRIGDYTTVVAEAREGVSRTAAAEARAAAAEARIRELEAQIAKPKLRRK